MAGVSKGLMLTILNLTTVLDLLLQWIGFRSRLVDT